MCVQTPTGLNLLQKESTLILMPRARACCSFQAGQLSGLERERGAPE